MRIKLNNLLRNGGKFFIIEFINRAPIPATPWYSKNDSDENNQRIRKAYKSLYTFTPLIEAKNIESGILHENSTRGELYLDGVYDGFLLYVNAIRDMMEEHENKNTDLIVRGVDVVNKMWGRVFQGKLILHNDYAPFK